VTRIPALDSAPQIDQRQGTFVKEEIDRVSNALDQGDVVEEV
jgi:hypothetical protein